MADRNSHLHCNFTMKRPLRLALCATLAATLLLGGGYVLHHHLRMQEALRPYPAEQVKAVREHLRLYEEMDSILAAKSSDEEKAAALEALRPRMMELSKRLRGMSSWRHHCIMRALGVDSNTTPLPALNEALDLRAAEEGRQTRAGKLAMELVNIPGSTPEGTQPADTAAELLRCVEELEAINKAGGLSDEEWLETHRLYHEKLLFIYCALRQGEDGGAAYSREVERLLQETPGAAEKLVRHLEQMKPEEWSEERENEASEPEYERHETLRSYHRALRKVVLHRLHELTPEGQQELERVADFLREQPGASYYLGFPLVMKGDEHWRVLLTLCPEQRTDEWKHIEFPLRGDEATQSATAREVDGFDSCLLRCNPTQLSAAENGQRKLKVEGGIPRSEFYNLQGGWYTLQRVWEKHPELRK